MYNQYPFSSMSYMPYNSISSPTTSGLFGLGKKAFNWNGFLDNAQRTLNVINQAMPIYNQVKPMFRNMGTVFKVIGVQQIVLLIRIMIHNFLHKKSSIL